MRRWDRVVREHGPAVFATVWHILGEVDEAEAVVQEVFRQAYGAGEGRGGSWGPLLLRLAASAALDQLRRRPPGPEAEHRPAARLRAALCRLPHLEAAAFALFYFDDLSESQIGEALQLGRAAVATTVAQGRARLEALLAQPAAEATPPAPPGPPCQIVRRPA